MNERRQNVWIAALLLLVSTGVSVAQVADPAIAPANHLPDLLALPPGERPVQVLARLHLYEVNEIDDGAESFEFTAVLNLEWRDPRQSFNPEVEGVDERIVQGNFQFNELRPAWYPQLILVNQSGLFELSGVVQRIRPDGTIILTQTINATAEVKLDMKGFPFDAHRLTAIFETLGFDQSEVLLRVDEDSLTLGSIEIPQWSVNGIELVARERSAPYAGTTGVASTIALAIDIERRSWYVRRLVVLPLAVIVLLSFSVFWMDESASLPDRLGVAFVGILTGVAYQMTISDQLPRISYFTLIHGFLGWSFFTMCATVVVSIVSVWMKDRSRAHRIDRRCRWAFPLAYVLVNLSMVVYANVLP